MPSSLVLSDQCLLRSEMLHRRNLSLALGEKPRFEFLKGRDSVVKTFDSPGGIVSTSLGLGGPSLNTIVGEISSLALFWTCQSRK